MLRRIVCFLSPPSRPMMIKYWFMRETVKDKGRLEHILAAIERIERFSADKTFESLRDDELTYYALVKCVEIIGEASYMLTNEFRDSHPQTEWRDIIAMRHVLVHGYYQVGVLQVWKVIQEDLPLLKEQIRRYYTEFIDK